MYIKKNGKKITLEELIRNRAIKLSGNKARVLKNSLIFSSDVISSVDTNGRVYVRFLYGDGLYARLSKGEETEQKTIIEIGKYKITKDRMTINPTLKEIFDKREIYNGEYELEKIKNVVGISNGDVLYKFKLIKNLTL